jgi:hypothetical protein
MIFLPPSPKIPKFGAPFSERWAQSSKQSFVSLSPTAAFSKTHPGMKLLTLASGYGRYNAITLGQKIVSAREWSSPVHAALQIYNRFSSKTFT